jgi:histidinol-phosphate aminotransferase
MAYFRACVQAMSAYVPGEQPPAGSRVVKLNTNENPYPPSPRVADAVAGELSGGGARLRLYSDPSAAELRRAAARAVGFSLEHVLAGNGSDELLAMVMRALVDPGDTVAYPYPNYVLYETLAAAQGARVETVDYPADFTLPSALFGCDAKVVFVATPNSPSGIAHGTGDLQRLAESLPRGVLVIDEAYADFARSSAVELASRLPNVIVTRTLSKSYSLAGMRLGLLFASPEMIAGLGKVKDSYNLDRLAIVAGRAALDDRPWMEANVAKIRATRERLARALEALGLRVLPSEANFVFARFGDPDAARGAYLALKDGGILTRYFDRPLLNDGLRITVGTDDEIDALLAAMGALRPEVSAPRGA